jgi:hypothetical protein
MLPGGWLANGEYQPPDKLQTDRIRQQAGSHGLRPESKADATRFPASAWTTILG